MTRKRVFLLCVGVLLGLTAFVGVRAWYWDRVERLEVDALVAELNERGEATERRARSIPELPAQPTPTDLSRQSKLLFEQMKATTEQGHALQERAEAAAEIASQQHRQRIIDALTRYANSLRRANEIFTRRLAEIRTKAGSVPIS